MARRATTGSRTIAVFGGENHNIDDLYDATALGYTIKLVPGTGELRVQIGDKWFVGEPDYVIEEVLDYVS